MNSVKLNLDPDLETGATEKVIRTPDDKEIDDLADSTKEVDESLGQVCLDSSEKSLGHKYSINSLDLFTATLPGGNCQKMEDDLHHSDQVHNLKYRPDYKPTQKTTQLMKITPKSKRKVLIKNEKRVNRGELDEIFERIRMKKESQNRKIDNEKGKLNANFEKNEKVEIKHEDKNVNNDDENSDENEKKAEDDERKDEKMKRKKKKKELC